MKRILILTTFLLTLAGCSKIANNSDSEARYYIRYEAKFNPVTSRASNHVSVATADGMITFGIGSSSAFSDVFGPFKPGFTAKIDQTVKELAFSSTDGVKIYVCRDNEPFVLAAYGNPNAEYTIEAY